MVCGKECVELGGALQKHRLYADRLDLVSLGKDLPQRNLVITFKKLISLAEELVVKMGTRRN